MFRYCFAKRADGGFPRLPLMKFPPDVLGGNGASSECSDRYPLPRPLFFICRDIDSTMPIWASSMTREVPP